MSTVNLCCRLDLRKIALQARNAEYNPRRFAAVIMRIRDPRTTALFFRSGKIVCTGAKRSVALTLADVKRRFRRRCYRVADRPQMFCSENDSKMAGRKFARIAQKLGFDVSYTKSVFFSF